MTAGTGDAAPSPEAAGRCFRISLPPERAAVVRAAGWLHEIAPALQADGRTLHRLDVCLEEILTNIVSYARATGRIEVEVRRNPGRIVVMIFDQGIPFDPWARPDPGEGRDLESANDGGRGIRIVRSLAGACAYRRIAGVNQMTLEFGPLPD